MDLGGEFLGGLEVRGFGVRGEGEFEGFGGFGRCGWRIGEVALGGEGGYFVEGRAGEGRGAVAGVEAEGVDFGRLGKGLGAELVGRLLAELKDGEAEGAGGGVVLEVEGELDGLGFGGEWGGWFGGGGLGGGGGGGVGGVRG